MTSQSAAAAPSRDEIIGERVHALTWRARMTQKSFAESLGMTQSAMSRKLRGERAWSSEELILIADRFGVSMDHLYGRDGGGRPAGDQPTDDTESRLSESNRRPSHYE